MATGLPETSPTVLKSQLHVGCGPKRKGQTLPAFQSTDWREVRFDIDESVSPDIVGTMTDMSAVESASMDALFSSHNVEHLYPHEVPVAFNEFNRVLKDDGFAIITCPDLQSVAALIAQDKFLDTAYVSPAGPITPLDILFGHRPSMARGNLYMAHHVGFTQKVLAGTLKPAGFGSVLTVRRPEQFDLWAFAMKQAVSDDVLRNNASRYLG
ncbi:methyltransferase domain-containing protein [Phaeovulum sp. NW3]|nr:methyltransferase domain-containing protein [Phaeovulum sp. NW3]MCL7466103.1 methyltransferase domain-containing protein [Phaeovulum sp. NW3]